MRPKDATVNLRTLHPDLWVALEEMDATAREFGLAEAVVTSGQDGVHGAGSKHHADSPDRPGEAVDVRVADLLTRYGARVRARLEARAPRTFDVVLEVTPTPCPGCGRCLKAPHLHIERDPR